MRSGIRFGWIRMIPWMEEEGSDDDEMMYAVVGIGDDDELVGKVDECVIDEITDNIGIVEIVCL